MRELVKVTWWDRFLMGIAPDWGMRRVRARATASLVAGRGGGYDAAGGGRRTENWRRSPSDANGEAAPSLAILRELSRDLRRNNGWARRGIQAIVNNTVGWGIRPKASASTPELAARATSLWRAWADSIGCDFDGRLPFYGIERLVLESVVESGEALIVREPAASTDGLAVPIRVRVLEPDYLATWKHGVRGEAGPINYGIEFDDRGRRAAYWLLERHPGSSGFANASFGAKRVPAADVIHVYQIERPGQVRGVPWLASAIARLNDFDDYEDATLMQQKVAACFGAFVSDMDAPSSALGEQSETDDRLETLEPGHIEYLPPGKSVTFAQPPSTANQSAFTQNNLRRIAASLGVTYEDLTGDYSQVNFSSARVARLAHWQNVHDWRWNMLIPQICDGVWRWVMGTAAALEGWKETPVAEWAPPPMPMLEPDKEGLAYSRMIRNGLSTFDEVIRELGGDPETQLAAIAATNTRLDELGIVLDCDPRQTNAQGAKQGAGAAPAGSNDQPANQDS